MKNEKGSAEAAEIVRKIRDQERARAGVTEDAYGHQSYNRRTSVTPEMRLEILRMLDDGIDRREIAKKFDVSYYAVNRIAAKYR